MKATTPYLILIAFLFFFAWFWYYTNQKISNQTEQENKARNELARKDSIIDANQKIMQQQARHVANLQLQYDSIEKQKETLSADLRKLQNKYKKLQDSLPTLTGGQQVDLFLTTFNIGSEYEGDFIAPVQGAYQSNLTWLRLQECNGAIKIKDTIIKTLIAQDLISRRQVAALQIAVDACALALDTCKSKDVEWQELIDIEAKKGKVRGRRGFGLGAIVGLVIGILIN